MGLLPSFNKSVRLGRSADRARTAIQTAQREGTAIPTREFEPMRRMLEKNSVFESIQSASAEDRSRTLGRLRAYANALALA